VGASGAEAVIVTSRAERLDRSWLGRTLSIDMLGDFDRLAVDPCGENGEYHTVVTNSPLFREPLRLEFGGQVSRSGCWALDVAVAGQTGSDPGVQRVGAGRVAKTAWCLTPWPRRRSRSRTTTARGRSSTACR
jgi:hypothetical protein